MRCQKVPPNRCRTGARVRLPPEEILCRSLQRRQVGVGGIGVSERPLLSGPTWQTSPMMLVAPYYGVVQSMRRTGWNPLLVERIRRCAYPQFIWDKLPSSALLTSQYSGLTARNPCLSTVERLRVPGFASMKMRSH